MSYTTTYRRHIQNEDFTDSVAYASFDIESGYIQNEDFTNSIECASFDIESGHLTWDVNPDIICCMPATEIRLKDKSSNTRW